MGQTEGLQASGLELWRGDRRLFCDLSARARPGELLHVTGPNGAGKTSLLRVLCGLTLPEAGVVRWNGRPIGKQRLEYHASLSYLGHRDGLKNDLSAIENVAATLGLSLTLEEAKIRETLAELGVRAAMELPVRSLSAGQRRRVAIGRCLLSETALWILDEPFANLDADGRAWCGARIGGHLREGGIAVITSHQALEVSAPVVARLEL